MVGRFACCLLLWIGTAVHAADISNPVDLMFVADSTAPIIDVVDLAEAEVVHRIETRFVANDLAVTPYAPILVYSNVETRTVVFYDLKNKTEYGSITLPFVPRHMVLDTTGSKIGVSDSQHGGFALLSAYSKSALFVLEDFPATADVLFDPNDVDIYYSNPATGSLGLLDVNLQKTFELQLTAEKNQVLSSPSRSLDSRHVYVANQTTGEVYSLNAYSKIIYKTFNIGDSPARPYTTPEGAFLYLMDRRSGRLVSIDQYEFEEFVDVELETGMDLVTVGRFDRMNLFLSSSSRSYSLFDNVRKSVVASGEFSAIPVDAAGAVDGKSAYVAFADIPQIAIYRLEDQQLTYIDATDNGAGAFVVGLTNNVCH